MKHFIYILLFSIVLSCSNDDDASSDANNSGFNGKWNLTNVMGGFVGLDHDFPVGTIIWDVNEMSKSVTVTNTNTDTTIYDVLPTGVYEYTIETLGERQELTVKDRNLGTFELKTDEFTIDEQFKDGFRLTFKR